MTEAEGQKVLGPSMIIRRQTATLWERLHFGNYDQLIRAMRMEDSSSFFIYTRMELPRVVLECKRATPTLGGQLNQAWSWPRRQERVRGANVEYT